MGTGQRARRAGPARGLGSLVGAAAVAVAALATGCASSGAGGRGGDGEDQPAGLPAGTFFWRAVRGDRDRLDDFRDVREQALAILGEAARFGGGDAPSPALELLGEAKETFDDASQPGELEARVAYYDRVEGAAGEGVELRLSRRSPGAPERTLRIAVEDMVVGGAVDGRIDRVRIAWSPGAWTNEGGPRPRPLLIEVGEEDGRVVEQVEVAEGARYRVMDPRVTSLYARVQRELYSPLAGAAFARLARSAPVPPRPRPAAPQGTSFPMPPAEVH